MHSLERLPDCLGWASQREDFISPHSQPGALLGCLDLLLLPSPAPLRGLHRAGGFTALGPGIPPSQEVRLNSHGCSEEQTGQT